LTPRNPSWCKGTVDLEPLAILIFVAICLALAIYMPSVSREKHAARTASAFFHALAAKDLDAAASFCTGGAKDAVLRGEGMKNKVLVSQVVDEKYDMQTEGCLAFVQAVVETETSDGDANVDWFDLKLERDVKKEWKIFSIAPARVVKPSVLDPPFSLWFKTKSVPAEAQEAFAAYLSDLAAGRYQDASRHLVGPALRAHAAASPVFGNAPLFKDVSAADWEWLASGGKLLVARASYTVDGRGTAVIVTFYRTRNGWKIVEIEKA
jgi:hypothetical protein